MLSPLWWLPLIAGALATIALGRGIVRLDQQRRQLESSLGRLREVRPLVEQVKAEIDQTKRGVEDRGHR